jgi:2-dehydropantoate 2-reductase
MATRSSGTGTTKLAFWVTVRRMTSEDPPLHIGIMGAGAIGCFVGGRLASANAARVTFVGRSSLGDLIAEHGLTVLAFDGERRVSSSRFQFATDAAALAQCEVVLVCVKSGSTPEAATALAEVLSPGAVVVSLQNGVRNAEVLQAQLPNNRVVAGIVGFNVVLQDRAVFKQSFTGPLVVEAQPDDQQWVAALRAAGLEVQTITPIGPEQWTKLIVNLNNAVAALAGASTPELILSPRFRRVMTMLLDEALRVVDAAGIETARFRGVPLRIMSFIFKLPTPIVRLVLSAQLKVDPEARASMYWDLERRRVTEVDFLNGELLELAESSGMDAPYNRRMTELVHEAERARQGSPRMPADALLAALTR